MSRFLRELRRREVLRTLGFYIGVCWILIQSSSVVLPALGTPDWVFRSLVALAIVGFPVAAVLAWVYDLTDGRIVVQADPTDTAALALGSRKMNFVVIGLLATALILSAYVNLTDGLGFGPTRKPVGVLVADFTNSTTNAAFDSLLEETLNIGIDGSPDIASFDRNAAESSARLLQPQAQGLPTSLARLVALREGLSLVLSGSIEPAASGFQLRLLGLDPLSGEARFQLSARAVNGDAVFAAVDELADAVREELGDQNLDGAYTVAETFTAASIEAADAYSEARQLGFEGRYEAAVASYRTATELDPNLASAYSGWAEAESALGREDEANALWDKALGLVATMTERERLRTLGLYYLNVTRNYAQAAARFSELLDRYPADVTGRHGLAMASFYQLDFETAAAENERVLEMFPENLLYRATSILFAMYAGDFGAAAAEARAMIESAPDYETAYLPLAASLLAAGNPDAARETYRQMAQTSSRSLHGKSIAMLGLADVAIYRGMLDEAEDLLSEGIAADIVGDLAGAAAVKQIALAESFARQGRYEMAVAAANNALELSQRDSIRTAAALVFLESGELDAATDLASELSAQLNDHSRAYGLMIEGAIQRRNGQLGEAISTLDEAIDVADLWRIRFERARAYLDDGSFADALDEFERCEQRRGEATAMFLDDIPTFRYLAELPSLLARTRERLP